MVSHPSRRALAFCAAVSLGIACIAPSQAAFAVEKAPAIPLVRPAVLSAAVTLPGAAAEEAVADLEQVRALAAQRAAEQAAEQRDKRLDYDPALIAAIGNQSTGGHTICCPAYACAYGDAILTSQANDHGAYGCGCCTAVLRLGRQFVVPLARLRRGFAARGLRRDRGRTASAVVHVAGSRRALDLPHGLPGRGGSRRARSTTSSRSIRRTA
ncbi:MAG: hypothetical protein ACLTMP_09745 [Eggerthella lenta]